MIVLLNTTDGTYDEEFAHILETLLGLHLRYGCGDVVAVVLTSQNWQGNLSGYLFYKPSKMNPMILSWRYDAETDKLTYAGHERRAWRPDLSQKEEVCL